MNTSGLLENCFSKSSSRGAIGCSHAGSCCITTASTKEDDFPSVPELHRVMLDTLRTPGHGPFKESSSLVRASASRHQLTASDIASYPSHFTLRTRSALVQTRKSARKTSLILSSEDILGGFTQFHIGHGAVQDEHQALFGPR